jgi:NAD(P)-dependent dehydrogenase (short-subunit alcohol dehydrogenase family)
MAVFRAAQKHLLKAGGKACFITSTVARPPGAGGLGVYAGTKGALHSWIQSESRRQIKHGVAMFAVSPGWFKSPMTAAMDPALVKRVTNAIPAKRFGESREIADFTLALLAQSNWCLAGRIYECSGGA